MATLATNPIKATPYDSRCYHPSYKEKREQLYKKMVRAHAMLGITNALIYSYSDQGPCAYLHIATSLWACKRIWSLQNEQLSNRKVENKDKFDELQYSYKFMSNANLILAIRSLYGAYANTNLFYTTCHCIGGFFYGLGSFVHNENLHKFKRDFKKFLQ